MADYLVKTFDSKSSIDFSSVPKALICNFKWREGYEPLSYAQVALVPGDGFYVRMISAEKEPLARFTEKGSPVCLDSALEFFVRFDPESMRYVNLETNANAALLAQCGTSRHDRIDVSERFDAESIRTSDGWGVTFTLKMDVIEDLFGLSRNDFVPGYSFFANFYKCGDETAAPHFGMWNEVNSQIPDFHRPEFFGRLVIG